VQGWEKGQLGQPGRASLAGADGTKGTHGRTRAGQVGSTKGQAAKQQERAMEGGQGVICVFMIYALPLAAQHANA
jgi:hypothetical protein